MGWFKSKSKAEAPTALAPAAPRAASAPVLSAAPPAAQAQAQVQVHRLPSDTKPEQATVAKKIGVKRLQSYADVPKFVRVMTVGERPAYKLSPTDALKLVAIELAGRKAIIVTIDDGTEPSALIESMRGALIAASYSVQPLQFASPSVIAEIYAAANATESLMSGGARSTNVYMAAVHEWMEYAVKNRATDVHIETRGSIGTVRFRIDGEMEDMSTDNHGSYPAAFVTKCMGALFNNEQQRKSGSDSLFEENKNLYCMVPYSEIPGHSLKLRYQSLKGNEGPKVVLRLLPVNENAKTLTFEELGYAESHIELWHTAMNTPSGAVLISGITGSGKSTTQKSFIELNPNAPSSAIYTVEDPVEYPIKYTHQIPIQRDLANPSESARLYSEIISALMRADPDIAMLGEIRDRHSASAAQQMTETGHLALGTVHAHLLSGIIPRLVNPEIGMNREVLTGPNMLTLLVYQALVARLCPDCAYDSIAAGSLLPGVAQVIQHLKELKLDTGAFRWKRPSGCSHCNNRGTIGQTVVAEMLMPDEDWLRPIRESRDVDAVEAYRSRSDCDLTSSNMDGKTVFEHTLYKAYTGAVDARQCSRFDNYARFVNRYSRLKKSAVSGLTTVRLT